MQQASQRYRTLYKRTANGLIQTWWMTRELDRYRTFTAKLDGVVTASEWTKALPKNVGRSNETSGIAQAQADVDAAYELKIKTGYGDSPEEAVTDKTFRPMLALEYSDYINKIDWDTAFVQPKLDGIRCLTSEHGMLSRKNTEIVSCPHIYEALYDILDMNPVVFDGELYNHELKRDFNKIVSLVRKTDLTEAELREARTKVQYHIYDLFADSNQPFADRHADLQSIREHLPPCIQLVPTMRVGSPQQLEALHESWVEAGYEGAMLRWGKDGYQQKRTKYLLKRKDGMDGEYRVLGLLEGVGGRSGTVGAAQLQTAEGKVFKSNVVGTEAELLRMWQQRARYAGVTATVIFQDLTPAGIPRFPRIKVFYPGERDL